MQTSRTALLLTALILAPAFSRAQQPAGDLNAPPPSVMTGTVEERNAAITKALTAKDAGTIKEFHVQDIAVETALRFIALQSKIDLTVDWPALQKAGVKRDATLTINAYDLSLPQTLALVTSLLKPTSGVIGYQVADGQLKIVPLAQPMPVDPATETRQNAAAADALKQQPVKNIPADAQVDLATLIHFLSMTAKLTIVIDQPDLDQAGIPHDLKITPPAPTPTAAAYLDALLAAAKLPDKPALTYKIEHGIIRITTTPIK